MSMFDPNPNETPILIPQRLRNKRNVASLVSYADHAHVLETGECIKNRFGPRCNSISNDPFENSRTLEPHKIQSDFVTAISGLANIWLSTWGARSGKTTARLMLAKAIIDGDK